MPMNKGLPDYFRTKTAPADIWKEYTRCKSFNSSIDLYETVKKNERFFSGDQWNGLKAPDIDTVTLNMLNRTVMYQIALIVADNIGVSVSKHGESDPQSEAVGKFLENSIDDIFEETSFYAMTRSCIRDAAVDGDCAVYAYWDTNKDRPAIEMVANTSVLFGNANVATVQDQPFILIESTRDLMDVRWQAFREGVEGWESIQPDNEQEQRQSDTQASGQQTVTVLKKLWRDLESGHIWYTECTQHVTLHEPIDTNLVLYPVAWMNWEAVKECYHGKAVVTGNIANQIAINRMWTGVLWHERQNAFPKVFYDKSKFPKGWDNKPGGVYAVNGGMTDAPATAFEPPKMDTNIIDVVDKTISMSRDFMGVNDVVLGNINPSNTSAIVAVQKATAAPLEIQKLNFYQFIEDVVRILIDLLLCNLGEREVVMDMDVPDPMTGETFTQKATAYINFSMLNYDDLKLHVDVGEAAYWSELTQIQTLDNLLQQGLITPDKYLESIPSKLIPHKNELVADFKRMQMTQSQPSVGNTIDVTADATRAEQLVARREEQMANEMQHL